MSKKDKILELLLEGVLTMEECTEMLDRIEEKEKPKEEDIPEPPIVY